MTMHLLPIYFTTTKHSRKRKRKFSQKQQKAQQEHEKFLKKMGVEDRPKSNFRTNIPDYSTRKTAPTSDNIGNGIRKNINTYTGDQIIGISAMHKSNLVPVSNKKNAIDMAKMRR